MDEAYRHGKPYRESVSCFVCASTSRQRRDTVWDTPLPRQLSLDRPE